MRKRIVKLWGIAASLIGAAAFIAVSPPSKAACILLALMLSVLAYWCFDTGMGLYARYRSIHPKRVKVRAWVR